MVENLKHGLSYSEASSEKSIVDLHPQKHDQMDLFFFFECSS